MGQKINPLGLRLGYNQNWTAQWYGAKNFSHYLQEDSIIREIIHKKYPRSGIDNIDFSRNRGDISVTIHTSKPGVIIGRNGAGAQELKSMIEKRIFQDIPAKNRSNLRISIVEFKNPELSAQIVGENIANQIERRISVKRAMKQAIERTMEKRAKGIKIRVSGRLGGAEIARSEVASQGSIPLQTIKSNLSYALVEAHTTYGIIGIKVWIYLGEADSFNIEMPNEQVNHHKSR